MRAVIVASGELAPTDVRWLDSADLVVAADGGAATLDALGTRPDLVVGDMDSVPSALLDRLATEGVRIERHPTDKDASDTELALSAALAAGASDVVLLGAIGGERLDHELANILLLTDAGLAGRDLRLAHGPTTVRVVRDGERLALAGRPGDLVTLLPIGGDVSGVTTDGLRWPLDGATLHLGRSRGLSNEVVAENASVRLEHGTLLVVETVIERSGA